MKPEEIKVGTIISNMIGSRTGEIVNVERSDDGEIYGEVRWGTDTCVTTYVVANASPRRVYVTDNYDMYDTVSVPNE